MSSSNVEAAKEVENALERNNDVPEWLVTFLSKKFFDKCQIHGNPRNDVNRYCITCSATLCKFCVVSENHGVHELLTIYRHVYQDVVPLDQMNRHMNCTRIQPYRCNRKWVISLTPLPHTGSGSLIIGDGACATCKRKLTEPGRFRFCSITCKLTAYRGGADVTISRHNSGAGTSSRRAEAASAVAAAVAEAEAEAKAEAEAETEAPTETHTRRSRKWRPHRAPLS